jgi:hypothetical protein
MKKLPEPAPKTLSEEKSYAEAINATKNLSWEAERCLPTAQKEELIWLRSQIDGVFNTKARSLLARISQLFQEVARNIAIPQQIQAVINLIEERLKCADYIAEMTKTLSDAHIKALEENREESKEELQTLATILNEFQIAFGTQYLPFSALHYFPAPTDEGIVLNAQILDHLEQIVLLEDEKALTDFTRLIFLAKLKARKMDIGPENADQYNPNDVSIRQLLTRTPIIFWPSPMSSKCVDPAR